MPLFRRSSRSLRPMTFILPGLFLLVLGIGNILVGSYKTDQYQQVIDNLGTAELPPVLRNASPLRRIQLAKLTESRSYQRRKTAITRIGFYRLVTFGGKVFSALSIPFVLAGLAIRFLDAQSQPRLH